jgi:predicted RNase H-like nuclease
MAAVEPIRGASAPAEAPPERGLRSIRRARRGGLWSVPSRGALYGHLFSLENRSNDVSTTAGGTDRGTPL